MDTSQLQARPDATASSPSQALRTTLLALTGALLLPTGGPATTSTALNKWMGSDEPAATATPTVIPSPPIVVTSSDDDRGPTPTPNTDPDATADYTGGIATRLHTTDGTPVPGHVFLLMATAGSDHTARLYDQTPYTHDNGTAADTHESNIAAADTVETITGIDIDLLELTTAPGGGPSGGITYTITYLNLISDGAFTGDLRVAATGKIGTHGYLHPINAIDEKTAAAHLANADVLFTPSTPTADHLDTYAARHVGEHFRARNTGSTLAEERRLDNYHAWGADRPDGMDLVHARHIADVSAYLCGAGSGYACDILDILDDTVIGGPSRAEDLEPAHTSMPADLR